MIHGRALHSILFNTNLRVNFKAGTEGCWGPGRGYKTQHKKGTYSLPKLNISVVTCLACFPFSTTGGISRRTKKNWWQTHTSKWLLLPSLFLMFFSLSSQGGWLGLPILWPRRSWADVDQPRDFSHPSNSRLLYWQLSQTASTCEFVGLSPPPLRAVEKNPAKEKLVNGWVGVNNYSSFRKPLCRSHDLNWPTNHRMKGSQEFQENSQEIKWALVSLLEHQDCSLNATRPILLFYYTK